MTNYFSREQANTKDIAEALVRAGIDPRTSDMPETAVALVLATLTEASGTIPPADTEHGRAYQAMTVVTSARRTGRRAEVVSALARVQDPELKLLKRTFAKVMAEDVFTDDPDLDTVREAITEVALTAPTGPSANAATETLHCLALSALADYFIAHPDAA